MKPLKFYPRSGLYKASNVTFNPSTMLALSYDWWIFVRKIGSVVVFNDYRYSPTTQRHQAKTRRVLDQLGVKYTTIEAPKGLQNLSDAVNYYECLIDGLKAKIERPRSHATKNLERNSRIALYRSKIVTLRFLEELEVTK